MCTSYVYFYIWVSKNVHTDINTYNRVNLNLRMTITYLSDKKCRRKPKKLQWNGWNRCTLARFTVLAFNTFIGSAERSWQRDHHEAKHTVPLFGNWEECTVHKTRTQDKIQRERYTHSHMQTFAKFSVFYIAMSTCTAHFYTHCLPFHFAFDNTETLWLGSRSPSSCSYTIILAMDAYALCLCILKTAIRCPK